MHTLINTPKAMAAIGPYNQAIRVGNLVFTSGRWGLIPRPASSLKGSTHRCT